jgi:hypothetical protein
MMRHAWLPIVLAALFGLRAPLCIAACGAAAAPSAAAAEAPCHGEEPTSTPEPAPHECECGSVQLLVAPQDAEWAVPALASATIGAGFLPPPSLARAAPRLDRPAHALPPPDLLLHHATLLL